MQVKLAGAIFGVDTASLEALDATTLQGLLFNPSSQLQELQATLVGVFNSSADSAVVREVATSVAQNVAQRLAARGGVPVEQLFPMLPSLLRAGTPSGSAARMPQSGAGSGRGAAAAAAAASPGQGAATTPSTEGDNNDNDSGSGSGGSEPPSDGGVVGSGTTTISFSNGVAYSDPSVRITPDVRGRSRGQDSSVDADSTRWGSNRSSDGNGSSSGSLRSMSTSSNGAATGAGAGESQNGSDFKRRPFEDVGRGSDGDVPAPVVDIVEEADLKLSRRTDGIKMIPL